MNLNDWYTLTAEQEQFKTVSEDLLTFHNLTKDNMEKILKKSLEYELSLQRKIIKG